MSYTITNKRGGHKKIYGIAEGKVILEFGRDNTAVIENKATADKLKRLGYGVKENKAKGDVDENKE